MRNHLFLFLLAVGVSLWAGSSFLDIEARVIPVPQKIEVVSGDVFPLTSERISFVVSSQEAPEAVIRQIQADCSLFWGMVPKVVCQKANADLQAEEYLLDTTAETIRISAAGMAGIRYALRTMRQLAEPARGGVRSTSFVMPRVKVRDFPQIAFRGLHYNNGACSLKDVERGLRLAAYCKYNYFVLEHPFETKCHPEFTRAGALTQEEVRGLVKLGKQLGITLIPQVQIFGHQSGIASHPHQVLDKDPAFAPLFEPSGSSWCISNPAVRQYIEDILLEYFELFDRPPYFHVGGDEAYNAGSCSLCRAGEPFWKKVAAHFTYFRDLMAQRNCRIMMWHDMLVQRDGEKWLGSTANGDADAEKLRKALPRDIIIDYWEYRFANHHYRDPEHGVPGFPLVDIFQKEGFDVLYSGWIYDTTPALGRKALETKGFGIMQTIWHQLKNSHDHHTIFALGSISGWNPLAEYPQLIDKRIFTVDILNRYIREADRDTRLAHPEWNLNP